MERRTASNKVEEPISDKWLRQADHESPATGSWFQAAFRDLCLVQARASWAGHGHTPPEASRRGVCLWYSAGNLGYAVLHGIAARW
jgi:hypothetical protein